MTAAFQLPPALLWILVPLIAWRVVARVRRLVGRQALRLPRLRFTLVVFAVLLAMLAVGNWRHPAALGALLAGAAAGAGLATIGIARTRFEALPHGLFFTPFAPIGIAVAVLFIGRLAYRLAEIALGAGTDGFTLHNPWTIGVFGLLGGYFAGHAAGLLRWHRRHAAGLVEGAA